MEVSGKAAVVTGGASGIGRGIAEVLAAAGATVAIVDIMEDDAARTAAEIGGRTIAVACDVTDRASVAAMKAEVNRRLGPVSLLVANAGVTKSLYNAIWRAQPHRLVFDLHVPWESPSGPAPGVISIGVNNVRIGRIEFRLQILPRKG